MLVLTRKSNQSIGINDNIKVAILRISGNSVTIGIEAPRKVRVLSDELGNSEGPCRRETCCELRDASEVLFRGTDPRVASLDFRQYPKYYGRQRCDPLVLHAPFCELHRVCGPLWRITKVLSACTVDMWASCG